MHRWDEPGTELQSGRQVGVDLVALVYAVVGGQPGPAASRVTVENRASGAMVSGDKAALADALSIVLSQVVNEGRVVVRLDRRDATYAIDLEESQGRPLLDHPPNLAKAEPVVEEHGGTVEVRTDPSGALRGVTVTLPVRAVSAEELAQAGSADAVASAEADVMPLAGRRVLVLDDQPDARELVQAVLECAGATVAVAGSVREALAILHHSRFDLILADIAMPEQDGYDFVRILRNLPPAHGGGTPALAFTAHGRPQDRQRAYAAGYQGHVAKPIAPDDLVAVVADFSKGADEGPRPRR